MFVIKDCYGYFVIQRSNNKKDYYERVTKFCDELDAVTLKMVSKRRNKAKLKKLTDKSK